MSTRECAERQRELGRVKSQPARYGHFIKIIYDYHLDNSLTLSFSRRRRDEDVSRSVFQHMLSDFSIMLISAIGILRAQQKYHVSIVQSCTASHSAFILNKKIKGN